MKGRACLGSQHITSVVAFKTLCAGLMARARRVATRVLSAPLRRAVSVAGKPAHLQLENPMTESENPRSHTLSSDVPTSTSSFSLEKYYRERLENVRQHLPEAAKQLKDAGVARVDIYYDGCGDSGQIEDIRYFDAQRKWINPPPVPTLSEDALRDLFYDLLETRHAGWENNDGAFGEFEWDLIADTLKHSHSDRYVECETTEHEGL